jgi:hypothetical protein
MVLGNWLNWNAIAYMEKKNICNTKEIQQEDRYAIT